MGKKKFSGVNSKAVDARARKLNEKKEKEEKKKKEAEDAAWRVTGKEAQMLRKAEEQRKKKEAAEAKRRELRELTKKEEDESAKLSKGGGRGNSASSAKMTAAERERIRQREREEAERRRKADEHTKKRITMVEEDAEVPENPNLKNQGELVARTVDRAAEEMAALKLSSSSSSTTSPDDDRHPEKRMKAAFKDYSARRLPILRKENPSLRLTQVKEMLWKEWQKSPENPLVQAAMGK